MTNVEHEAVRAKSAFYDAWWYLMEHPMFMDEHRMVDFSSYLTIDVLTSEERAHGFCISIEHGPWALADPEIPGLAHGAPGYDPNLDVYADTFEKAIIALAQKVKVRYSDTSLPPGSYFGLPGSRDEDPPISRSSTAAASP